MGCVHSSPALGSSSQKSGDNGSNKLEGSAATKIHDPGSSKGNSETPWSSIDSQAEMANFTRGISLVQPRVSPPEIQWKLSLEEIEHKHALNNLDETKRRGISLLDVPKCRVGLFSCTHLWISTRTGAFSPALQVEGTPYQGNFDHFYLDKRTDPFVMEDARLDPRCKTHPGVIGRPNMRFYIGAPLLSRGHLLGILYLACSQPRPRPSPEKIAQLVDIANNTAANLQEDMFKCLLADNTKSIDNDTITRDTIELPAVWIDTSTPKWRVVGVNEAWETLTGVPYHALSEYQGLLEAMIPSNEGGLVNAVESAHSSPGVSIPAILSPCAPNGASLQYIFALKPATDLQKRPSTAFYNGIYRTSVVNPETDIKKEIEIDPIWIAEVHARIQAAADPTGNLLIDSSGMAHKLLPSTDPLFGTLLKDRKSTLFFPGFSHHQSYYYQHQFPYSSSGGGNGPTSGNHSGETGTGGSGGSSSGGATTIPSTSTTTRPSMSLDGGNRRTSMSAHLAPLLVSATSVLEVGSMHIPPRLASLQLGPLLGKGSYGSVYWGTLGDNGVAIKVTQQAPGPEATEQMWAAQYEAMVASDLCHDNLVRTIDWCCYREAHTHSSGVGGVMWLVQELCNKGSLAVAIKDGALRENQVVEAPPDMHAVLETAADVACGMAYLHSHDVLHGDLSNNNVLFISANNSRGYRAKVTDFGLSRTLGGQDVTKTVGTVSHMPPELLTSGVLSKAGDVYSFGVMLWELYTGKRAWEGSSQAQVIFAITCKNATLELPKDAPAGYAALTKACMHQDRLKRPAFDEIVKKWLDSDPEPLLLLERYLIAMWDTYTWLFVCSIFLALFVAWGIGANDVANAFGTSVGAKALTMKQAILVASVCEFGGAVLLGSGVTDTIKSGIAKVSAYTYEPELLMYGMVCALLAAGLWLALATFLELPVSTTHSIVGAIIGMSLVGAGVDSVVWYSAPKPGSPFPGGVVSIILAWFITPAMAAIVAALLFLFTKLVVLKARDPFKRSLLLFPLYTFITVWVVTYFVIQKGVNGWMKPKTYTATSPITAPTNASCPPAGTGGTYKIKTSATEYTSSLTGCTIPDGNNAWISAVTAAVVTVICIAALKGIVKLVERDLANAEAQDAATETHKAAVSAGGAEAGVVGADAKDAGVFTAEPLDDADVPHNRTPAMLQSMRRSKVWTSLAYGSNYDIHDSIADDPKLMAMHNEAELFDRKTEFSFKYLQVLTACANSFAHGANDVANAIGSMASVYAIWQCACANSKANVPIWMFVIGGVGLIIGLATYGYKIIRSLGVKMTKLTNSRGYCAELTAAVIVIVASRYGFPVSTTQVITGAITGVGIEEVISAKLRGEKNASGRFNFKLLLKFFAGWVATLIFAGLTAAAFMAQGIYAPSRQQTDYRANLNEAFNATNVGMSNVLLAAGNVTAPTPAQQAATLAGQAIVNATKLTWNSNNSTMLNTDFYMQIFQSGTYALGNASIAGVVVPETYMPELPELNPISFS